VFHHFTSILALIPPPSLVDAICTTIDTVLRQSAETNWRGTVVVPEQINTEYAEQVCTRALAKALCDLVMLGADYASPAVFGALRYFVGSPEFAAVSALDSSRLVRLSEADDTGVVRRAAQDMHAQQLLAAYTMLPFPKPDFPLVKECLFLTDPDTFKVQGTEFTHWSFLRLETAVVFPTLDQVCSLHPLFIHSHPTGQVAVVCSSFSSPLIFFSQPRPDPP
jgi:hypothetical protein